MSSKNKEYLKGRFANGCVPDETDFEDLLDSGVNKQDDVDATIPATAQAGHVPSSGAVKEYVGRVAPTKDELTQLSAQVGDLSTELSSLSKGVDSANAVHEEITDKLMNAQVVSLNYQDNVVNKLYANASGNKFLSNNYDSYGVYYVKILTDRRYHYKHNASAPSSSSLASICISDSIPAAGVDMEVIAGFGAGTEGDFSINANQYLCICVATIGTAKYYPTITYTEYSAKDFASGTSLNALGSRVTSLESSISGAASFESIPSARKVDFFREIYRERFVDLFPNTAYWAKCLTKIGMFTPTASTANTVTLSSSDIACFDRMLIISAKCNDGSYYNIMVSAPSGTSLEKVFDWGYNVDMTSIVEFMALHDEVYESETTGGLHLTPYGYRAFAKVAADNLQSKYCEESRFVGGFISRDCAKTGAASTPITHSTSGNTLAEIAETDFRVAGSTGMAGCSSGRNFACTFSIVNDGNQGKLGANWSAKNLMIKQGVAGSYAKIRFRFGFPIKGFVKICAVCPIEGDAEGTAKISLYNKSNTLISQYDIPRIASNIYADLGPDPLDEVIVKFEILQNKNTMVLINYITFYESYASNGLGINSDSKVAILGSSNTQYPQSNAKYIALVAGDADNEVCVWPDGGSVSGKMGYSYYPKELARQLNCDVDNWGACGTNTEWGLSMLDRVFAYKKYTHIVLTLFGNDFTGGISIENTIRNISMMCAYAKSKGCIPIVIESYGVGSSTSLISNYAKFHDELQMGFSGAYLM